MTASYGTVKTEYGKQWIYLNPNPAEGPFTWDVAYLPEVDDPTIIDDIENLYTVPPIMNNQVGQQANLYFSIEDCKARNEPDSTLRSLLPDKVALYLDHGDLPPTSWNGLFDLHELVGEAPIASRQNDKDAYLWFDIDGLDPVDIDRKRRFKVKAGYNSRSVTSLTADSPLFVESEDGLATVSFDITTLPDA